MKIRFILLIFLNLITGLLIAQTTWEVPADRNAKLSTEAFTEQTRAAGQILYQTNCKSCHGDPGKNNSIKLVPPPPDPASPQMQQNTDGSLHFKISEGRVTMPAFKNVLSSADIWNVIAYIRSYNKDYNQQIAIKPTYGGEIFDKVEIQLSSDPSANAIVAKVSGSRGSIVKPIVGLEVKLFVKRYFGNLVVDKPSDTDAAGKAIFTLPKSLPGDASGNLTLLAQLANEELFGLVKAESILAIGIPTNKPALNEERAMWNVVQKTPIWLLISYLTSVLVVWGFIIYVLLQLKRIFELGEK